MNERINLNFDLEIISKDICNNYKLGDYYSNEIIEVGYQDFNYILKTSSGNYCIKIFNKERTLEDCLNYIDRIELSAKIGVNSPHVYKYNNKAMYTKVINDVLFRLCVFEYIDGNSFYDLDIIPTDDDIKEIINQMALIHHAKLESNFIYDNWTITNFKEEFDNKKKYLSDNDLDILLQLRKKFDEVDFSKLVYSFVHGDIISSNVIKDKNNKLWIIDYAVSNYLPRIVDIVVTSCNLCLDPNSISNTRDKIKLILNEYEKYNKLEAYEKEIIPFFFALANAMGVLQTCYEAAMGNDSDENQYWLNISKKGLEYYYANMFDDIA